MLFTLQSCNKEAPEVPEEQRYPNSGNPVSEVSAINGEVKYEMAYNEDKRMVSMMKDYLDLSMAYADGNIDFAFLEYFSGSVLRHYKFFYTDAMLDSILVYYSSSDIETMKIGYDTVSRVFIFKSEVLNEEIQIDFDENEDIEKITRIYDSAHYSQARFQYNTSAPGIFRSANLTIVDKAIIAYLVGFDFSGDSEGLNQLFMLSSHRLETLEYQYDTNSNEADSYYIYYDFDLDGYPYRATRQGGEHMDYQSLEYTY